MMMTLDESDARARPLRELVEGVTERLGRFPLAILQLIFRFSIASVFFKSGHSKILSWDTTILLFANEYRVPVLSPEIAATLSASCELGCSTLIFLGLLTRLATLPLRGLPIGVKDIYDTADFPTQYGSSIYAGHRPRADAAMVALIRRAGGVVIGKTVTTEFASLQPARTRNPHNLAHTPGGSSSGSAAAVAAGVPFAEKLAHHRIPAEIARNIKPLRSALEYAASQTHELQISFFLRVQ